MKILHYLDEHFEEAVLVVLLSAMSIIIGVQIFMRYVVQESLTWSEELARYLFIWVSYIGVSYAVKRHAHIRVEAAVMFMPPKVKKYVYIFSNVIFLVFALMVVKEGFILSMKIFNFGQSSPAMGIPMGYVYLAPAVGFLLVFIRLIQSLIKNIKELNVKEEQK
ncbi:MAG: TRAP transporter small permease [Deferribacterales bacterium]|jgi:TRAP-type C4-dicarboxylate transport system permease small subunit